MSKNTRLSHKHHSSSKQQHARQQSLRKNDQKNFKSVKHTKNSHLASVVTHQEKAKSYCRFSNQCGACQMIDVAYEKQLQEKQLQMKQLFKAYGTVSPIIGMEKPYYYRNKVHAVFKQERFGEIIAGTYMEGTHKVIPVKNCLIEDKNASQIIQSIYKLSRSFKYPIFNEDTREGFLRHVLIRVGKQTGEILVVIVTGKRPFPSKKHFVEALLKAHPEITSVVQSINGEHTNMILGEREEILYGKGYIEDVLCGCRFKISAKSFYQVNAIQTEKLYKKAFELAELSGKEKVIDAYCGIGTIGIIASKRCKKVWGVELNRTAVRDAVINAGLNHCENITFTEADASEWIIERARKDETVDVIFMDPPRAGSTKYFIDAVSQLAPKKVIYISCNPETLKRDLAWFVSNRYEVKQIVPVDLFPHTIHVETVCLMSRKEK